MTDDISIQELKNSLNTLEEALNYTAQVTSPNPDDQVHFKIARDACIQRFEYCIELSWKTAMKKLGCKVYVFGSRAKDTQHPFSDVDILVENDSGVDSRMITQIQDQLDESRFPFKVEIALKKSLAQNYIETVEKQKIEI